MTKLGTILDQIDAGTMLLPEFQRGYVWNRDQVRGLMRSLYRDYPVGALLIWETEGVNQAVRGAPVVTGGPKQLLLDGQQRITTLYGLIKGRPPSFFEGDPTAFKGLRFNVANESFEFYAPVKMKDDPRWIDVTAFFHDSNPHYQSIIGLPDAQANLGTYTQRLSQLKSVLQRDFHAERITGADKTVDVVVDIFNRVNSGGTKLSKGDLALARICAEWGDARPSMRRALAAWADKGYNFSLDWLLRNVNAVATGKTPFSALEDVSARDFEVALGEASDHVSHFLELVSGRLGLDHDRVLMGRYAVPVISRLLHDRNGRFAGGQEADKALYWYVHSALRGRFAGSSETMLTKDLETLEKAGMDGLIASLKRWRGGNISIDAQDFEGLGRGSRFYPLLYLLTRVHDARDFTTGMPINQPDASLHVHEIFPKALLYKHGYSRSEVNAVANFGFLSAASSERINKRGPSDYLRRSDPALLSSQWIPADPKLWEVENYREFLAARRDLLAAAANKFLDDLLAGQVNWSPALPQVEVSGETDESDARASQIASLVTELTDLGFSQPAVDAEIADPETGRVLAVAEAFWADGLQVGQGSPVVLELDPEEADIARLTELGCEVFTSVDALRGYVHRRNAVASGARSDDVGVDTADVDPVDLEPTDLDAGALDPSDGDDTGPGLGLDGSASQSGPGTQQSFDDAVRGLVERCRAELQYDPKYFKIMVAQHGSLGAVRRLLMAPGVSDGFVKLWERQRLDLAAESLVVDERYRHLFTPKELNIAHTRLANFSEGVSSRSA
ncbi:MAG TPA: DUF262 domain-containing protein [Pseudonocardia sp.]|jgi:hypothetical protein|nr:DUF262 domain-containing protein [Pseudonocardia sp.]